MDEIIIVVFVVGGIALVVGGIIAAIWMEKKRLQAMQILATELGLEFFPLGNDQIWPTVSDFALFGQGRDRKVTKLIVAATEELSIAIFDYQYTVGSGKQVQTHHQSVVSLESAQLKLPKFVMRPESMLDRIGGMLGQQDIDFEGHDDFSRKFVLAGPDEESIRKYFRPELLSFFVQHPDLCVEANFDRLIFYRRGKRVSPVEVKNALALAYELHGTLVADAGAETTD
jgi:hypothetical protein